MQVAVFKVEKATFRNKWGLSVSPHQTPYVCKDLDAFVDGFRGDSQFTCYMILKDGVPAGFFALDSSYDRHRAYVPVVDAFVVLRCFFVDSRYQGSGIASLALLQLKGIVAKDFPGVRQIYLTVNLRNGSAYKRYEATGFESIDPLYLGGGSGPQRVMIMKL